ncbi:MAG: RHS repeat-associated core domain-containing protein [Kiritimatiellia bacterium]
MLDDKKTYARIGVIPRVWALAAVFMNLTVDPPEVVSEWPCVSDCQRDASGVSFALDDTSCDLDFSFIGLPEEASVSYVLLAGGAVVEVGDGTRLPLSSFPDADAVRFLSADASVDWGAVTSVRARVATRPMVMQRTGNWNLFYTHDGNKNVSELVYYQRARGVAAHYEYAPFGAVTARTRGDNWGTLDFSSLNPYRFSSEFADDATATVYYNYRHYEPVTGRWLTRDPAGGQMLYRFVSNRVVGVNDFIGLLVPSYDNGRYSVDGKTCTMTVNMKIRFIFEDGRLGKWDEESEKKWASSVVKLVNAYFNGGYVSYKKEQYRKWGMQSPVKAYRCRSDCAKKCKDGISVKFKFATTSGSDYDFKLAVKYDELRSWANPAVQTSPTDDFGDSDLKVNGELSVNDNKTVSKGTVDGTEYWQIVVVHEIGHLLGMSHPGQTAENVLGGRSAADSEEDYNVNAASLMGKGMVLTDTDFNDAFCSHIDKNKFGRGWRAK